MAPGSTDRGERDLNRLLAALCPELLPGDYVFCTVLSDSPEAFFDLDPLAFLREAQGLTLVLPLANARDAGFPCDTPMRRITLNVHSSLEAVGLTAVVATALADEGISANVLAGYYHDHIFVPAARADAALVALQRLSARG